LIVVDDHSQDGTEDIVNSLSTDYPVRIIVRHDERGLSSAVLTGFAEAESDVFVVLDGDLQHPPEAIPDLLQQLERGDCDFVIGTRYAKGGGIEDDWPAMRRLASRVASFLAWPLTPLSDPMSGFFAIRRGTWEHAARLDPVGYKIAMELYVKGRCRQPAEVPIRFATRSAGASKLNLTQRLQYLRHLAKLYYFRFSWAVVVIAFAGLILVGAGVLAVIRAFYPE
jgi:dolichol-phosphate mannosyltransferase